ncbi:MAG: insulinase family protein [Acidobacteria bacterium]|nr:insulinase family protein [Acidobacteriota bacterium]
MIGRLTLSLLLAALAAPAQPIPDRPEKLSYPPVAFQVPRAKDFKVKLKNGVTAFLAPHGKEGTPLVRLSLSWRGGAYLDPVGKEGLAQMFGSQLAQGGTRQLDASKLEDRLEAMAATLSSMNGDTSGNLSLQALDSDFPEALGLFMQVLTEPAFGQDRLDLAKRQARQALGRRNDAVTSIASYQMGYLLSGEKHFSSAAPTAASLEAISREDLLGLHARLLHPANLVVAVSGSFERKAMTETLQRTLGSLKPGPAAQASPKVPGPDFARTPGLYLTDKEAPQAMVQWAFPGLRRSDPDWHAAVVMNQILGAGGFTSRLMKKIRSDEGLTYGVRTALGTGAHWRGDLTGGLQTKNRSVAYALRLALAEMERLKAEPVGAAELAVIKDGLVEAFPTGWGGPQAIAGRFAEEALLGWPEDWWADYREKIQAVTPADVQRMAKKLLDPDRLVVLAVGKASEMGPGDPDHPGALKDVVRLPSFKLPLRDPLTLKPLP